MNLSDAPHLAPEVSQSTILDLPRWISRGIIAIDGPSGSGKTVLAKKLRDQYISRHYSVNLIHCDWFATWDNPVGWWREMQATIIDPLLRGQAVWFRPMLWKDGQARPGPKQYLERSTVIIIEGVSAARKSMEPLIDYAIWMDGGSMADCLERAVARDGEEYRTELRRWKDFELGWFSVDQTASRCHRVIMTDE